MNVAKLSVTSGQKKLVDVNDIKIPPFTLNAIIGKSGSGKTTFCRGITGHIECDATSSIFIKNTRTTRGDRVKWSNFISSHTVMFEELTVFETIYLANKMYSNCESTVSQVIQQFELQSCSSTRVSCISAGERKRTHIARNIVNGAPFLILDEPISELDDISANKVVNILKSLTDTITVVCTIHALHRLDLFDNVTIFKEGLCQFHGSSTFCEQLQKRMAVPLLNITHECREIADFKYIALHEHTKPVSWIRQCLCHFEHQSIVYRRIHAFYQLAGFSLAIVFLANMLFGYWDSEYDEYIRSFAIGLHLILFMYYFPFTFTSVLNPFKHSFIPGVCIDSINNSRDILTFIVADQCITCACSVLITVIVYILKSYIFTDVNYTMELFTVAAYYTIIIINIIYACLLLSKNFYVSQSYTQLVLVFILLSNGVTFPVRALGKIFEIMYCINPINSFMRVAYDKNVKEYDVAEIFKPFECYWDPISYLRLLLVVTSLLLMLAARRSCRI